MLLKAQVRGVLFSESGENVPLHSIPPRTGRFGKLVPKGQVGQRRVSERGRVLLEERKKKEKHTLSLPVALRD